MDSTRQKKFSRLIQKDLGEIFQREAAHLFGGAFITVTQVMVSPDLSLAKVYLSFLLSKNPAATLQEVREQTKYLRQLLANRIRHQARIIPDLNFYIDDTMEVTEEVQRLFEKIDIPAEGQHKLNEADYRKLED